jgi:hypothetical protein
MKRIAFAVGLVVLVFAAAVLAQTAVQKAPAKARPPEQQEVLDVFSGFFAAALRGNFEEIKTYWHPNIVAWDINQDSPMIHDDFLKGEEGFFKDFKFTKLEFRLKAKQRSSISSMLGCSLTVRAKRPRCPGIGQQPW